MSEQVAADKDPLEERFGAEMQVATEEDRQAARDALAESRALVAHYLGSNANDCPEVVQNRAVIECAGELYQRRAARNGVMIFGGDDVQTVRVARDPMVAARPMLRPYILGFA